jgi:hypothetical protein
MAATGDERCDDAQHTILIGARLVRGWGPSRRRLRAAWDGRRILEVVRLAGEVEGYKYRAIGRLTMASVEFVGSPPLFYTIGADREKDRASFQPCPGEQIPAYS